MTTETKKVLSEEQVIDIISKATGIDIFELLYKKSRKRELVDSRQIAMYFLRKYVKSKKTRNEPISYQAVGRIFKKHHATIMHAVEVVESMIDTNKEYRAKLYEYDRMLYRLGSDNLCVFCNRPLEEKSGFPKNCYVS